jgi:hypothetical protein
LIGSGQKINNIKNLYSMAALNPFLVVIDMQVGWEGTRTPKSGGETVPKMWRAVISRLKICWKREMRSTYTETGG